jgi:protein-S-isoprenylcysteine O-methyltransferase Ste14
MIWIDLVYIVATGSWKRRLILLPVVGALFFSFIVVFVYFSGTVDRWLHLPKMLWPWSPIVGGLLVVHGGLLALLSVSCFVRARGTPVPLSPPPKLVTSGPYRFVRNPMLTGGFAVLFGLGIIFGSVTLTCIFTPLFIVINVWELKRVEEPELVRRLGKEYEEYRKRVPMFFPCFGKV